MASLVPVDHDPFATPQGPTLVPVEGDPFAASGPSLVPVDHDPFAVAAGPAPTPPEGFGAGFVHGIERGFESIPDSERGFVEMGARLAGLTSQADAMAASRTAAAAGQPPSAEPTFSKQPMAWVGSQIGSGLASTTPSIAGALVGAGLGSLLGPAGTVGGGILGAGGVAYSQNSGDFYNELVAAGVDPNVSADIAAIGGAVITVPDVASLGVMLRPFSGAARKVLTQAAAQSIAKRVASGAWKGASVESITEALQEAVQMATVAVATGKTPAGEDIAERLGGAAVGGAGAGGGVGAVTGAMSKPAAVPEAVPAEEPAAITPTGIDPASMERFQGDVRRAVEERYPAIEADTETDEAAREATAAERTARINADLTAAFQNAGLPPFGSTVEVDTPDGPIRGRLETVIGGRVRVRVDEDTYADVAPGRLRKVLEEAGTEQVPYSGPAAFDDTIDQATRGPSTPDLERMGAEVAKVADRPAPGTRIEFTGPQGERRTGTVLAYGVRQGSGQIDTGRMRIQDDEGFESAPWVDVANPRPLAKPIAPPTSTLADIAKGTATEGLGAVVGRGPSAIRIDGVVFAGKEHADAVDEANRAGFSDDDIDARGQIGLVTPAGEFLDYMDDDAFRGTAGRPTGVARPTRPATEGLGRVAGEAKPTPIAASDSSLTRTASWVVRDKSTGKAVLETFDPKKVEALNTEKYEAVPIGEYLGDYNRRVREAGGVEPPTPTPEPPPTQPIPSADDTETPEFKRWFGESKVVDESGRALRVYHGTNVDVTAFDPSRAGTANRTQKGHVEQEAIWFSANPKEAVAFSGASPHGFNAVEGARVMPVHLKMDNPLIVDAEVAGPKSGSTAYINRNGRRLYNISYFKDRYLADAKSGGYDGVIFKNGYDGWAEGGDVYAVFSPTQIKSAIGNRGTYDPESPDITQQTVRGAGSRIPESGPTFFYKGSELRSSESDPERRAASYVAEMGDVDAARAYLEDTYGKWGYNQDGKWEKQYPPKERAVLDALDSVDESQIKRYSAQQMAKRRRREDLSSEAALGRAIGVRHDVSPYYSNFDQVAAAVRAEVARLGGPGIDTRVYDDFTIDGDPTQGAVNPQPNPVNNIVVVALGHRDERGDPHSNEDPIGTARHEFVHYIRRVGLISGPDWKLLRAEAGRSWRQAFDVNRRWKNAYLKQANREEWLDEEAVAEALSIYPRRGGKFVYRGRVVEIRPEVRPIFDRLIDFLDGVARRVRHILGRRSWRDVLFEIESGQKAGLIVDGRGRTLAYRMVDAEGGGISLRDERTGDIVGTYETRAEATAEAEWQTWQDDAESAVYAAVETNLDTEAQTQALVDPEGYAYRARQEISKQPVETARRPRSLLSHISGMQLAATFPRGLAAIDRASSRFFGAFTAKDQHRQKLLSRYVRMMTTYVAAPRATKDKLHRVFEALRLMSTAPVNTGDPLVVRATVDGTLVKAGDVISLSPRETQIFFDMQRLFRALWGDRITAILRMMGYEGPVSRDDLKRTVQDSTGRERARAEKRLAVFEELDRARRRAYVPFQRFGDYFIRVREKNIAVEGVDDSLGGKGEVILREHVWGDRRWRLGARVEVEGTVPKGARKRLAELRAEYPKDKYDIDHGYLRPDPARDIDVSLFEEIIDSINAGNHEAYASIAAEMGMDPQAAWSADTDRLREAAHDALIDKLYERIKADFAKRSFNIPGYSEDFERAISEHVRHAAGNTANIYFRAEIEQARLGVMTHSNRNIAEFWRKYEDRQNSGASDWAAARKLGFLYLIAGSPASALVNLTQTPLVTTFNIGMWAGHGRAQAITWRAILETASKIGVDKRGFKIRVADLGSNEAERAMLTRLHDNGTLADQFTQDLQGLQSTERRDARRAVNALGQAYDILASMFGSAEVTNRAATALAAFRAAQPESARRKAEEVYADNQTFAELRDRYGGVTPEMLAHFMVDETQFVSGKINRPPIGTGVGAAILQFKTFTMNYIGLLNRLVRRSGSQGRLAAAMMGISTFAVAGAMGLPFAEDIMALASMMLDDDDDLLREIEDWIIEDLGWSPEIAEGILRGPSREALGVDLGRRIGQGALLPDFTAWEAILGVPGAITVGRYKEVKARYESGQYPSFLFAMADAMLPQAARNVMAATMMWPKNGVETRYGNPVLSPEELSDTDIVAKAFGLNPAKVARAHEYRYAESQIAGEDSKEKRDIYTRLARILEQQDRLKPEGDQKKWAELEDEFESIWVANAEKLALTIEGVRRAYYRRIDPEGAMWDRTPRAKREELLRYRERYEEGE